MARKTGKSELGRKVKEEGWMEVGLDEFIAIGPGPVNFLEFLVSRAQPQGYG